MESESPPSRFLSMPEPRLPGLCLRPPGWWQGEDQATLLTLVSSGRDHHGLSVPCSVKAEPLKATRYLPQPTEDILGSS